MIINIKNMVCKRCEMIVNDILRQLNIEGKFISMGQLMLKKNITHYQIRQLNLALKETGLEIIFDKKSLLVQKVKDIIYEIIYCCEEPLPVKFSYYLSSRLHYNYTYLASIFSQETGLSIEHYIILQKIEKVKSMLVIEDFILSEIAAKMNYSSVGHLSAQFKKVTGLTASDYKSLQLQTAMLQTA
ncbi:helix-turn-helix domain-containing protein [Ferruginibacter profundus]